MELRMNLNFLAVRKESWSKWRVLLRHEEESRQFLKILPAYRNEYFSFPFFPSLLLSFVLSQGGSLNKRSVLFCLVWFG